LNLEAVIRAVGDQVPGTIADLVGDLRAAHRLARVMDDVEDYWETGPGNDQLTDPGIGINHNLAIWGWDIRDAMSLNVGRLRDRVAAESPRDNVLKQIPSAAGERSALITLAGGKPADTPLSLAHELGTDGGIETLVVALGANNILGATIDFNIVWSGDGYDDVDSPAKATYNAWQPTHFATEFDLLMKRVVDIAAQHVIVFTVPHVTITPMLRGVGDKMPGSRYFARYTRPWITDEQFDPNRHPCLTGDQLRVLDSVVDRYNDHIVTAVAAAGPRFHVLDVAGILDRLAYRRFMIDKNAQPPWWTPYDMPDEYTALSPQPDSRFFRSDRFGRSQGGLFALDGVHPTTVGYALITREVMNLMTHIGVPLDATQPDFHQIIARDSLISNPPAQLQNALEFVNIANRAADLYQSWRHRVPV
jgi:hypothetical protein